MSLSYHFMRLYEISIKPFIVSIQEIEKEKVMITCGISI